MLETFTSILRFRPSPSGHRRDKTGLSSLLFLTLLSFALSAGDLLSVGFPSESQMGAQHLDWSAKAPGLAYFTNASAVFLPPDGCFSGINAGDNSTFCAGEAATLDGGYDGSYSGPGTVSITWSMPDGDEGTFFIGGVDQGNIAATSANFNNSENSVTGFPDVTFVPDAGVTEIRLRLSATTSGDPDCTASEVEDVIIYFDPVQESPTEISVQGVLEIDAATGAGNEVTMENGETLKLESDEDFVIDNGQQFDDIRKYNYTVTGSGIDGLPVSGIGTQTEFNAAFEDLVLTNTTCDVATATIEVFAFYDRNVINFPQPSGDCAGPVTEIIVNVEPRPVIEATLAAIDDILIVCEDDNLVEVVVTGTPLTTIDYSINYGGGSPVNGSLELDENGIDNSSIVLDANNAVNGEMTATLTGGIYTDDAPGCPVVLSEILTFSVLPLPTLAVDVLNPEDLIVCDLLNNGTNPVPLLFTTTSGDGFYDFDVQVLTNGVVTNTVTLTNQEFVNGERVIDFTRSILDEMTYRILGTSITKLGPAPQCTNAAPDAEVTILVQEESFVEFAVSIDGEVGQLLNDNGGPDDNLQLDLSLCDESELDIEMLNPLTDNSSIFGITAALQVEISNPDAVPNVPATGTYTYDFDANRFDFTQELDIPNNQTEASNLTFVFTPYFEDNSSPGLDGDECIGTPLTLNVEILAAPTVTVEVSAPEVCDGETVIVTITASVPGTANLILNQGGAPIPIDVSTPSGDNYVGTYLSNPLDVLTRFTVTNFVGSGDPSCFATVNQMVMTEVEENPEGEVIMDDVYLCEGDDTFVTLTGVGGANNGYKFVYTIDGATPQMVMTAGTDASVNIDIVDPAPGPHTITLINVANKGGLMCSTDVGTEVDFDVEATPLVDVIADDNICSGDEITFPLTSPSPNPSVVPSSLYYKVEINNPLAGTPVSGVSILADADSPVVTGSPVNETGEPQDLTVTVTPFYFPDAQGTPSQTDFDDACQGTPTSATITVETVPNATFGGDETICAGETALLTITGPANGVVVIDIVNENSVVLDNLGTFALDAGGEANVPTGNLSETTIFQITSISTNPAVEPVCERSSTFERTIFVIPTPDAEFAGDRNVNICEGTATSFAITGTPNAVVQVTPNNGDAPFEVSLDENGDGSFQTGILVSGIRYDLTLVTITEQNNGEPQACTFVPDNRTTARVRIDPAPTGALVSNRILCAGDTPEIQFNATNGDNYEGTYTIVVNGVTYGGISDGDVLDLGAAAGAMVTTPFTLESIVQENAPMCSDIINGDIYTVQAVVNQVPTASLDLEIEGATTTVTDGVNDPFIAVICSGDEVDLSLTGTPPVSNSGDPLFFEIMVTADDAGLTSGAGTYRVDEPDAATLSAALGLPGNFVNPSTTLDAKLEFMITPYFEFDPSDPVGFGVGALPTEGFTGNFAPGNWVTASGVNSDVSFSGTTTLTLTSGDAVGGTFQPFDDAIATIPVPETGTASFDYSFLLENFGFVADFVIVDFEGTVTYLFSPAPSFFSGSVSGSGSFSEVIAGGSSLTILIIGDDTTPFNIESNFTISNFLFEPSAQPCPGEKIAVDLTIKPRLFAGFDNEELTVCEGDQPEICLTGTPDATVTVYLGDGVFTDVKLDDNGNGCFVPASGLLPPSIKFTITGITTLGQDPECSLIYGPTGPMLNVTVTPTPLASVSIDPATVCAGDAASALVTGTPGAMVTYSINGGTSATAQLDESGEVTLPLPTENESMVDATTTITLSNVAITINEVVCVAPLSVTADLTIRPLPMGVIEAGEPVCNGEEVPITFTALTPVVESYQIRITGPDGFDEIYTTASGAVVFNATVPGEYTLRRVRDGIGSDLVCTKTGIMNSTTVIIEEEPSLTAQISGTVGTASLDNQTLLNAFRGVACDMGTIEAVFGSATLTSDPGTAHPLFVQVDVITNEDLMLGLPAGPATFTVPFGDLSFAGILDNVDDIGNSNITVVLTPYFENGTDLETLNEEECEGPALTFNITILPAVTLEFDAGLSTDEVCEGDAVSIALTGSPGGVVSFSTTNLIGASSSPITLGPDGTAVISATAGPQSAGDAQVTLDMIQVMTTVGGIGRMCMEMPDIDFDITINEKPMATLFVDPAGPVCNGQSTDVWAMLMDTGSEPGDQFTFVVNGTPYPGVVDVDGKAMLFNSGSLTETTTYSLSLVINEQTGCSKSTGENEATIEVEEVPAGKITATGDVPMTMVQNGVAETLTICANESIDLTASMSTGLLTPGAANFVSVVYSDPLEFYGRGTSGTVSLPVGDFAAEFSRQYTTISGVPVTITLELTYYIETDPDNEGDKDLDDGECRGITDRLTIVINPNPKTADIGAMSCSRVAFDVDLDDAIVNNMPDDLATYSYTVAGYPGNNRPVASSDNVTDTYENFTGEPFDVIYRVTPFGPTGCQGNDFNLTLTVKPEPVIAAEQDVTICSGDPTTLNITLVNDIAESEAFEIIAITYDLTGPEFEPAPSNAQIGDIEDLTIIAGDVFINTSSEPQDVVYTIRPTSAAGCVGDIIMITVTVLPEPVVADFMVKVCSGGELDLSILDGLTANGVGSEVSFTRSALPLTTLRVFDENGDDVTLATFAGNSTSNPGLSSINDSYLNQGTATLSVFYEVAILNGECEPATFTLQVKVLEETNVVLEPINGQTAICAGMPVTLVSNFDGTTTPSYEYSVMEADPGVNIVLSPSAAGGEVSVDGVGSGNATIMVMVTDGNGCVAMGTRVVSVGDSPEPVEIVGFDDPCTNTLSFYDVPFTEGSTYQWSLSNPAAGVFTDPTGNEVEITFNSSVGYGPFTIFVTETGASGCSTTSSLQVTLTDETTADFTFEIDEVTQTVAFTEQASGSVETFYWEFGDGEVSTDPNPVHSYELVDPNAMESFEVTLTVAGGCSNNLETATKIVTFNSGEVEDVIALRRGTNFISFDIDFADNSPTSVFASVLGLERVATVEDTEGKTYFPDRPIFFNSLREVKPGYGYLVVVDRDQEFTVSGTPLPETFDRGMDDGVNFVAYIPQAEVDSDEHLGALETAGMLEVARTFGRNVTPNTQSYFPGRPLFFQSLKKFYNGIGYMIVSNEQVPPAGRAAASTEFFDFVFGTVHGIDETGGVVEILDATGNVVGHLEPNGQGQFAATPIYGKVERTNGSIVGAFEVDEAISFRYGDQVISSDVVFTGEYKGTWVDLDFTGGTANDVAMDELQVSVFPNPAGEEATVSITTTEDMEIEVLAMDANGRIVAKLLPAQYFPAGTIRIDWADLSSLPAGMYHVIVNRDGRIISEATRRLVKR